MKAHIFLFIIPKFQLQIHYTLEGYERKMYLLQVYQFLISNVFFIIASSRVSHSYFASREQTRSNLEIKLYKMCQSQSVESEKSTVKIGTIPFKLKDPSKNNLRPIAKFRCTAWQLLSKISNFHKIALNFTFLQESNFLKYTWNFFDQLLLPYKF